MKEEGGFKNYRAVAAQVPTPDPPLTSQFHRDRYFTSLSCSSPIYKMVGIVTSSGRKGEEAA